MNFVDLEIDLGLGARVLGRIYLANAINIGLELCDGELYKSLTYAYTYVFIFNCISIELRVELTTDISPRPHAHAYTLYR